MTTKENIEYLKQFGWKITFFKALRKITFNTYNKLSWKIHLINNNVIEKYIIKTCPNTYKEMQSEKIENIPPAKSDSDLSNNIIWTLWWQGEQNAPKIIKTCINSMRKFSNGHRVIVIDKNNYEEYCALPEYIIEKFNNETGSDSPLKKTILGMTHLSDIIRCSLLASYGGVWADATICFTQDIPEKYFTDQWTSLGQDNHWYIGEGRWSVFFMGCQKGSKVMLLEYKFHIEYWKNNNFYINYLLLDYMMDIIYNNCPDVKETIDNVSSGNKKCLTIHHNYNKPAFENEIKEFLAHQGIHKLSWKWWGRDENADVSLYTENKELTWFGYVYENYLS